MGKHFLSIKILQPHRHKYFLTFQILFNSLALSALMKPVVVDVPMAMPLSTNLMAVYALLFIKSEIVCESKCGLIMALFCISIFRITLAVFIEMCTVSFPV